MTIFHQETSSRTPPWAETVNESKDDTAGIQSKHEDSSEGLDQRGTDALRGPSDQAAPEQNCEAAQNAGVSASLESGQLDLHDALEALVPADNADILDSEPEATSDEDRPSSEYANFWVHTSRDERAGPFQGLTKYPALTSTERKKIEAAAANLTPGTVWPVETDDLPNFGMTNMTCELSPCQLLSTARMRAIENGKNNPVVGGILALDMGLGKTIVALANLIDASHTMKVKAIIVLPIALVAQWQEEIKKRCAKGAFKYVSTMTSEHSVTTQTLDMLLSFSDIVLTTYSCLRLALVDSKTHTNKKLSSKKKNESRAAVFETQFTHAIFDESTYITNPTTAFSDMARSLKATHKWALSGTPTRNSVNEYFTYFSMTNNPHSENFASFKKHYLRSDGVADEFISALSHMQIRMDNTKPLFGRPMMKIPEPIRDWKKVTMGPAERYFHFTLANAIGDGLDDASARVDMPYDPEMAPIGSVETRSYGELVYLRQAATSLLLLPQFIGRLVKNGDKRLWTPLQKLLGETLREAPLKASMGAFRDLFRDMARPSKGRKGLKIRKGPKVRKGCKGRKRGKGSTPFLRYLNQAKNTNNYFGMEKPSRVIPVSAKMKAVVEQVGEFKEADESTKIVVWVYFQDTGNVLHSLFQDQGWAVATYHGKQTLDKRNENLEIFKGDPKCQILIASYAAGGLGLNLQEATKAILVDLWWNDAMQEQAFARIFRRGQDKVTHFVKFYTEGTFDEIVYRVQSKKEEELRKSLERSQTNMTDFKQPKPVALQYADMHRGIMDLNKHLDTDEPDFRLLKDGMKAALDSEFQTVKKRGRSSSLCKTEPRPNGDPTVDNSEDWEDSSDSTFDSSEYDDDESSDEEVPEEPVRKTKKARTKR